MNIPNRASDAGPESLSHCQKCDASLRNNDTHECSKCTGPCCDGCAQEFGAKWICRVCIKRVECDWCGDPIEGEQPVAGYDGNPTHRKCRRDALRAERMDKGIDDRPVDREPFIDWPNGQGV